MAQKNIIKRTCKEFGLTYKQLAECIGYNGDSINTMAGKSDGELSVPLKKSIELYRETLTLKQQLQNTQVLKNAIKVLLTEE
ncbi:transcriptional regulator [Helicobacter anatolicus]|uniref:transcriptional regulator n=1 Tax=Helicobacter anatolicus TaxID=2905874 RepID=UPI001E385E72|nr:transcriptional regulator [Helicobacter anatolicus]MCE3039889.1 transcriptional regulator [Helicobacter anatolicus]